jgi:hypothetical protein
MKLRAEIEVTDETGTQRRALDLELDAVAVVSASTLGHLSASLLEAIVESWPGSCASLDEEEDDDDDDDDGGALPRFPTNVL